MTDRNREMKKEKEGQRRDCFAAHLQSDTPLCVTELSVNVLRSTGYTPHYGYITDATLASSTKFPISYSSPSPPHPHPTSYFLSDRPPLPWSFIFPFVAMEMTAVGISPVTSSSSERLIASQTPTNNCHNISAFK